MSGKRRYAFGADHLPPISTGLGRLGASRMDALPPSFYNGCVPFVF